MQLFSVDATMHKFLAHENMKKPPQKVAYLSRNSVIFEIYSLPNSPRVHVPKCGEHITHLHTSDIVTSETDITDT